MILFLDTDVLHNAQAEIDAIVGNDRLPTFADRDMLPYVNAVVSEVLRWNSVAPTGVVSSPRSSSNLMPYSRSPSYCHGRRRNKWLLHSKGLCYHRQSLVSLVVIHFSGYSSNSFRNMLHDPEIYPDPFTFDPTRHIAAPGKPAQRDPRLACFGYGRRICPGMHLAEASLFILIAMSLAVFDITKAVENGVPITPVHENTSGIIRYASHVNLCLAINLTDIRRSVTRSHSSIPFDHDQRRPWPSLSLKSLNG